MSDLKSEPFVWQSGPPRLAEKIFVTREECWRNANGQQFDALMLMRAQRATIMLREAAEKMGWFEQPEAAVAPPAIPEAERCTYLRDGGYSRDTCRSRRAPDKDFCQKHLDKTCCNCGKTGVTKGCVSAGSLVCGMSVCADCTYCSYHDRNHPRWNKAAT